MSTFWMVRAGRGGEKVDDFVEKGVVALGDGKLGELARSMTKDDLLRLYAERYAEAKDGSRQVWASQVVRFLSEIKVGESVITYHRGRRIYFLGVVKSDYQWQPDLVEGMPHIRRVSWTHQVPRDGLAVATLNTLGAIMTLFKVVGDVAKDLQAHQIPIGEPDQVVAPPRPVEVVDAEDSDAALRAEMVEKADDFIEDAINRLNWQKMQELVAGILRSMGYRTLVSPPGSDRGVDIFASPDGLGLQEPRIFVEVKDRGTTPMGADKIRSFVGGRKPGDKCLYVSTGSFTKEARYEAARANVATTLIGLQELRELLVDQYEKLDAETRALVPLKRLYWPLG